jgi:hypothetical protein
MKDFDRVRSKPRQAAAARNGRHDMRLNNRSIDKP